MLRSSALDEGEGEANADDGQSKKSDLHLEAKEGDNPGGDGSADIGGYAILS